MIQRKIIGYYERDNLWGRRDILDSVIWGIIEKMIFKLSPDR